LEPEPDKAAKSREMSREEGKEKASQPLYLKRYE
jgi:hypothetical protein